MIDMNSKKGKLIMVMGPPASGKSTLAAEVHTELKKKGINSAFVSERKPYRDLKRLVEDSQLDRKLKLKYY